VAESLVLTSLAGYLGIVVGVGVLELASRITASMPQAPLSEPEVDIKVVLAAGAILLIGGFVAAIMPARHATRIHPVEALRAE
jgi:putative ABC transport system permease protein